MDKLETPLLPNAPDHVADPRPAPAAPFARCMHAARAVILVFLLAVLIALFALVLGLACRVAADRLLYAEQDAANRPACEVQVAMRMHGFLDAFEAACAADPADGVARVRLGVYAARALRDFESQVYWCLRDARVWPHNFHA